MGSSNSYQAHFTNDEIRKEDFPKMDNTSDELNDIYARRSARIQMACLWTVPIAALMIFGGILFAGMLPPPSPDLSATEIQKFFLDNTNHIRIGILFTIFGQALAGFFVVILSMQMKRVEGRDSPLAYMQLLVGLFSNMIGIIPFSFLLVAAFRGDRSAELIQLLFDLCWLMNIGIIAPTIIQFLIVGASAFLDKPERVFPRWYAWFSVWAAFILFADMLIFFVKTGPFAFNGAICFWLELAIFSAWMTTTFLVLRRSVIKSGEPGQSNNDYGSLLSSTEIDR